MCHLSPGRCGSSSAERHQQRGTLAQPYERVAEVASRLGGYFLDTISCHLGSESLPRYKLLFADVFSGLPCRPLTSQSQTAKTKTH
jgi:hypothetical protein